MGEHAVKFAVTREDHRVEAALVRRLGARRVLLVASGGCTALSLAALAPSLVIDLFDRNPAQLELVGRKRDLLCSRRADGAALRRAFGIGCDDPTSLAGDGAFEALFRSLRAFLHGFVASPEELAAAFADEDGPSALRRRLAISRFWPVALDMHFADATLAALFGPDAIRHGAPGSYPGWFGRSVARGLGRRGASRNPFLHRILLGFTPDRDDLLPPYLVRPLPPRPFGMTEGTLADCRGLDGYDLVGLSNVMDWMTDRDIAALADDLGRRLRPGAAMLWRQLNHRRDLQAAFAGLFAFDPLLSRRLLARDRSLFYSSLHVGIRR